MLTDLHIHLGGAVPAPVLWEIAQDQGLSIPQQTFQEFQTALSSEGKIHKNLDAFLGKYFHLTEAIQSSPQAVATSIYQTIAKSHRRGGTTLLEIRFNPAKRLRGGLHSIDAILLSACQGLERASLHYHTQAGILLSLGRDCDHKTNTQILEAAIRWHKARPEIIIGIDIAGPESQNNENDKNWLSLTSKLFQKAMTHGLKTTYHVGETPHTGWQGVQKVLESIRPNRIGHGVELRKAPLQKKTKLLNILSTTQTCLEICPSVNLATQSIKQIKELQQFTQELHQNEVPFTICTDNPYLVHTNPKREIEILFPENSPEKTWANQCGPKFTFLTCKPSKDSFPSPATSLSTQE